MVEDNNAKKPTFKDYESTTFGSVVATAWEGGRPKFTFRVDKDVREDPRFLEYGEFAINKMDVKIISDFVEGVMSRIG